MSCCILSTDMLAIMLVVADGDINMPIEEVITNISIYQKKYDRIFGVSDSDFASVIRRLYIFDLYEIFLATPNEIKLKYTIPYILLQSEAYFKDTEDG
jgi:hypothetical protein